MRKSVIAFCLTTLLVGAAAFTLKSKSSSKKVPAPRPHAGSRSLQQLECIGASNAFASCLETNGYYGADGHSSDNFDCNVCDASKDAFYVLCGGGNDRSVRSLLEAISHLFGLGLPEPAGGAPAPLSRSTVNIVFDGVGSCPGMN